MPIEYAPLKILQEKITYIVFPCYFLYNPHVLFFIRSVVVTARKILSNTFVQVLGKFTMALLGFVSVKLVAVYLSVEERGVYESAFNFLALAGTFADMGLYTIAIREYAKGEYAKEKVLGNILAIRQLLSLAVLGCAFLLFFVIPAYRGMGWNFFAAIVIFGAATMVALLNGTVTGVLQAEYQMKHATLAQVLGKVGTIVLMCLGIFVLFPRTSSMYEALGPVGFWGFQWLYVSALLGNIAMYLYTRHHVKKIVPIRYQCDMEYWKKLFKEALPYGIALALSAFYFKIDVTLIPLFFDAKTAHEMIAIYVGATKILENFSIIPLFFLNALLPLILQLMKEEHWERLKSVVQSSLDLLFLMSLPIAVGGYTLAYPIIFVTNKQDYLSRLASGFVGSDQILKIVIFAVFFSYLGLLFNFLLVAQGKQKKLILINGLTLLFNILMNLLLLPRFGILASAWITVASEAIVLVLTYHFAQQDLQMRFAFGRIMRILLSALLMGAVLWYTRDMIIVLFGSFMGLMILGLLAMLTYGLALVLLRVIDRDILRLLKRTE